jgi:hypothetical protein
MEEFPIVDTRAANSCPEKASSSTTAESPIEIIGTSVSSTTITASMAERSPIVRSRLPALFIVPTTAVSPSSMLSRITRPLIGARIVVRESCSAASSRAARA